MKKHSDYRLIKEYPGSYKVGYILKALNGYEAGKYWINNNWFCPEDYPEYWEIVKEPILTTEDGVDYYDKMDKCIWVDMKNYRYGTQPFISESTKEQTAAGKFIFFSTEKNALAWIEENKPQFSKKDMIQFAKCSRNLNKDKPSEEYFVQYINSYYNLKNWNKDE